MPKIIKTALASFGMSSQVFHGPLLKDHPGFAVTRILERTKDLSRKVFPEARIVRDYKKILADPDIHLVIVNTPDRHHASMAAQALKAGKHVVVEKPFTLTTREGEVLISLAEKKGLILTVFQNRRWDSDFLTLKKILENRLVGKLVEMESRFDRFRNYIQPATWKEDRYEGTGVLYNLGSHLIDQALVLFGLPRLVDGNIRIQRTGSKVNDYFDIQLEYGRFKVILRSSYLVREPEPRFILHGTNGSFIKYGSDPQEEALKQGLIPSGTPGWGREEEKNWGLLNTDLDDLHFRGRIESLPGDYGAFYRNLYEVITGKAELAVKPQEALRVIRIIEAAQESDRIKTSIRL